jgi:hypothetical protein
MNERFEQFRFASRFGGDICDGSPLKAVEKSISLRRGDQEE